MNADLQAPASSTDRDNAHGNKPFTTICNLCSVGCALQINTQNGRITDDVKGSEGLINPKAEMCWFPVKEYRKINSFERITEPMLRTGNEFKPITWEAAFTLIHEKICNSAPEEMAFFAGARLTNEEQYLVQKLARGGAATNNIGSFHYLGRGTGYTRLSRANIPFAELTEAKKIFIIGAEVDRDNPVVGELIFLNLQEELGIEVTLVTDNPYSRLIDRARHNIVVESYFHFVQAINHYIVSHELEDNEYIKNLVENFADYRKHLLSLDFQLLCETAGITPVVVEEFVKSFHNEHNAVLIFSENQLSGYSCGEIFNLALLSGKHGRTGAGLLLLKENNNSHGLHDMGVMWNLGVGAIPWEDPFQRSTFEFVWGRHDMPYNKAALYHDLLNGKLRNLFIFGEDPVGCAKEPKVWKKALKKTDFIMVQEYWMTPTASMANLILPATFAFETGGTYTNSQRVIQKVDKTMPCVPSLASWQQLDALLSLFGFAHFDSNIDITFEIASLLPKFCTSSKLMFRINDQDNYNPLFTFGCDAMFKLAEYFKS